MCTPVLTYLLFYIFPVTENQIVNDNLLNRDTLVQGADIIIMNNVFQFFAPVEIQRQLWEFLYSNIRHKKGTILITIPSLQDQLKDAGFDMDGKKPKSKKKKVPAKPPGAVSAPSPSSSTESESAVSIGNVSSWLKEIEVKVTGEEFVEEMMEDELEDLKMIHVYEVI